MRAKSLTPPGEAAEFFAPLALTVQEGVCAAPVTSEDPTDTLAVEFTHEGEAVQVFARHSASIGELAPYRVSVAIARKFYPDLPAGQGGPCQVSDVPLYFFSSLMRLASEN